MTNRPALLLALLLAAPALAAPPDHVVAARDRVDWDAAGAEAVGVLSGYLATDTVNPPGNELAGVTYLGAVLEQEGIAWHSVDHGPGRASLVARIEGSGKAPPLCLLSHIDVVPAELDHWTFDPLSGKVEDGVVYGRGALDMKGVGALQTMVMVWLKRLQVPLDRDVVLLAVADEEDHNIGMQAMAARWDEIGCSHLMNEGGMGIEDAFFDGQDVHGISVAEKGYLWVRMIARGPAGHGSVINEGEAPNTLQEALAAVAKRKAKPMMTSEFKALLKAVGKHHGGVTGAALDSGFLRGMLAKPKLMKIPATRSLLTNTVHLTNLRAGVSPNVVPSTAEAVYDCRLLPGVEPDDMLAELRHLVRKIDGIEFEVIDVDPSAGSAWEGDGLYDAIARYAVEDRPQAVAAPFLSVGFTDSVYARQLGVTAFGYAPFVVSREMAESMHGHDERVPVDQVHEGLRRLFSTVVDFAGSPAE